MEYRTLKNSRKATFLGRFKVAQTGQSLLEFALLLPSLCLLLIGVVDLGRAAYMSIVVSRRSRCGRPIWRPKPKNGGGFGDA